MGAFLETEKMRYRTWKNSTRYLTDAARKDGGYPKSKDPDKEYPFCIEENCTQENLFNEIRGPALAYFTERGIPWHDGVNGGPSSHLCDSQVSCVNFLFPFAHNPDALVALLKPLFPGINTVLPMEEQMPPSYVAFEWIGLGDYLGECKRPDGRRTRGANATSADAAVMFEDDRNNRYIVLIEWKYTESYGKTSKAIPVRLETYGKFYDDGLLHTDRVPNFEDLFYEPFYQLMRQQMLAREIARHNELGANFASVLHIAPEINLDFQKVTSPGLTSLGRTTIDVWKSIVRDPEVFASVSTELLFGNLPITRFPQMSAWWSYINERYSWIRQGRDQKIQ
jgi:hypothetical protein